MRVVVTSGRRELGAAEEVVIARAGYRPAARRAADAANRGTLGANIRRSAPGVRWTVATPLEVVARHRREPAVIEEGADSAVVVSFHISTQSIARYDRAMTDDPVLRAQADRLVHVCFEAVDGFTVIDVWRSADSFHEFEAHLDDVEPGRHDPEHLLYRSRLEVRAVHNLVI